MPGSSARATASSRADPAKVVAAADFPDIKLETAELNRGNLLLYSLLSNSRFMSWAEDYHAGLVKRATAATEIEDDEEALRGFRSDGSVDNPFRPCSRRCEKPPIRHRLRRAKQSCTA